MNKPLIHRDKPVYTCIECVNSVPQGGTLYCPVFQCEVRTSDKACIYKSAKMK